MRLKLALTALLAACALDAAEGSALQWTELPVPTAHSPAQGAFVVEVGGRLVIAGGRLDEGGPALRDAWVLDAPDAGWRETTPLPEPASFGAAVTDGESAFFVGGSSPSNEAGRESAFRVSLKGEELSYDPLPDLPARASDSDAAMLDGVLYVVSATSVDTPASQPASMWMLDLNAEDPEWLAAPAPPANVCEFPVLAAQDGALFLFGGTPLAQQDGPQGQQHAYRYTAGSGWTPIADLPSPALPTAALPVGPTHIALRTAAGSGTSILAYHSVTDTWVDLGILPARLSGESAATWGESLVFTGRDLGVEQSGNRIQSARIQPPSTGFSIIDYVTLIAYFGVLVMMGLYFARQGSGTEDFFLAGRRMPWWATGLSIFGTQLSSISFMAVPAKVYSTDWVYFLLQMTIIMVAFPVVFFYLPHFRRAKMTSAYEYLEKRFNLPVRMYASVSFVLYQLGRMAIVLFLPAIALSTVTGIGVYTCIVLMGVLATLYTVMGGIKAVIWTDVVQVFVLYGGALLSLVILLFKTDGGLAAIVSEGIEYDKFHMFNWTWDWTTTAVWVVIVGNFFLNLVPYTSDQAVVQRYFTTKDEKAAAKSIWTNAALLLPSTLTLFLLGTGMWAFYRSNPELLNPTLPTDSIFPLFIAQQLPVGIAGLLIAAVFAASMSTLDSSLNSVSAALVTDFYVRFRPSASDSRRLFLARLLTAGLGVLATATSIALATFDIGSLWDTFQGMMGLLGGGLAGLFALGIFFRSANGAGAMTGAVASVFILYWVQQHTDLHFFLYGAVGIMSCVLVALATSPFYRPSRA
ncbi:MAG: sodium/solute symporter [Bryobacterales bacterium]|nr:sodium/solute symporter [Bryobacterales bacterium]